MATDAVPPEILAEVQRPHDANIHHDIDVEATTTSTSRLRRGATTRSTGRVAYSKSFKRKLASIEKSTEKTATLLIFKFASEIFLSALVLLCLVFSKLSLVGLVDNLHVISELVRNGTQLTEETNTQATSIYWQLLIILLIPNALTFLRCLLFGSLGKSSETFPVPSKISLMVGMLVSFGEVVAISTLLFLVTSEFSPGVSILLLSGVFIIQILINTFDKDACCSLQQKYRVSVAEYPSNESNPLSTSRFRAICCVSLKVVAFLLQSIAIFGIIGYVIYTTVVLEEPLNFRLVIGLPFALVLLSIVWSDRVQEFIAKSSIKDKAGNYRSGRYKSSMINSLLRIILYPFITYVIFRYATPFQVDPWCLNDNCSIDISNSTVGLMVIHIIASFLGYLSIWVSFTMAINQFSLGLSILLSSPIAAGLYYATKYIAFLNRFYVYFFVNDVDEDLLYNAPVIPVLAFLLWIGEVLAMGYFICTKKNLILAKDQDMFLTPHYNSVFLKQHVMMNRQVKNNDLELIPQNINSSSSDPTAPRTIFICSTMYRENSTEMEQMLTSIYRVAISFSKRDPFWQNCEVESHIFMDGALNGNQIENFGLQLLSLVEKAFGIDLKSSRSLEKTITPYGYRISLKIGAHGTKVRMPFCIHFKDKNLVKPKKRWSQVMYMNYVMNYRIRQKNLNPNNTFILTTDADVDFSANSAIVLLDMLAIDENVAAVCARTHPLGSGPLYWYQIFDYAIGHWFQKPAEHIMGSVLCAPGCFSVYRCSALAKVLKEYSTETEGGIDFLKKDMGEDRWLCTLLIKEGLRLEYCAISEDSTYCPTDFDEFFKQRRRWIPSTVANLMQLIMESKNITQNNDSISIIFILYQILIMFSTAIAPATVILIISAGLDNYNLGISNIIVISFFVVVALLYGLVCLYASPQAQLDVAKILSFAFALLMIIVFIGILRGIVEEFAPTTTPEPPTVMTEADTTTMMTNTTSSSSTFELPVAISTIYIGVLVALFPFAAMCHISEWHQVFHGVWFLLGLPAGYLLLPIYSAANLVDRSWGTREQKTGEDEGVWGWRKYPLMVWQLLTETILSKCCKKENTVENEAENEALLPVSRPHSDTLSVYSDNMSISIEVPQKDAYFTNEFTRMEPDALEWLRRNKAERYIESFELHGYTNTHFIADMRMKDFESIGIDQLGFRLRLEKSAKTLPPLHIDVQVPTNIANWLNILELGMYKEMFHDAGYEMEEDMENLKKLDEKKLIGIGVNKRAHLRRLLKAINSLRKPSGAEQKKRRAKAIIDSLETNTLDEGETTFWEILIGRKLKPVSSQFTSSEDIHKALLNLRNSTLVIFFFVNISWLILLGYFSFEQLGRFNIDPRVIQIVFLAIYGFLLLIQTLTMLAHRVITLIHYLGRI